MIRPSAEHYVECASSIGLPQLLVSRFTGEKTFITKRKDLGGNKKWKNDYYPSPEMHKYLAQKLIAKIRKEDYFSPSDLIVEYK